VPTTEVDLQVITRNTLLKIGKRSADGCIKVTQIVTKRHGIAHGWKLKPQVLKLVPGIIKPLTLLPERFLSTVSAKSNSSLDMLPKN
jgi:hypothetical protein